MQARPSSSDDAHPRRGGWRPLLWTLPLLLSLVFVAGVIAWVWANELGERELERQTLITDALSTEAQLRSRIAEEAALLRRLATGRAGRCRGPRGHAGRALRPLAAAEERCALVAFAQVRGADGGQRRPGDRQH